MSTSCSQRQDKHVIRAMPAKGNRIEALSRWSFFLNAFLLILAGVVWLSTGPETVSRVAPLDGPKPPSPRPIDSPQDTPPPAIQKPDINNDSEAEDLSRRLPDIPHVFLPFSLAKDLVFKSASPAYDNAIRLVDFAGRPTKYLNDFGLSQEESQQVLETIGGHLAEYQDLLARHANPVTREGAYLAREIALPQAQLERIHLAIEHSLVSAYGPGEGAAYAHVTLGSFGDPEANRNLTYVLEVRDEPNAYSLRIHEPDGNTVYNCAIGSQSIGTHRLVGPVFGTN